MKTRKFRRTLAKMDQSPKTWSLNRESGGESAMRVQKRDIVTNVREAVLPDVALREVQEFLADKFRGKAVRIYEAGGGSLSILPLSSLTNPSITVVDIDETQLRNNRYADTKILGDIQTYILPANSFDLIVCYNVVEHLPSVDQAIRQFHHALAPGGLVFIGAPNPESLFGLVTKYSPHWFHVWFYRVILRHKEAGKPGQLPFRTFYHPIVSPKALLKFCDKIGFEAVYFNLYIGSNYTSLRKTRPIVGWMVAAALSVMNILTFGRLKLAHGDYHVVLQKSVPHAMP
jgi:2-polyprenyl-3-methyl-5-hydroxy-6-metoxy-1,4-benzoquinol methylase